MRPTTILLTLLLIGVMILGITIYHLYWDNVLPNGIQQRDRVVQKTKQSTNTNTTTAQKVYGAHEKQQLPPPPPRRKVVVSRSRYITLEITAYTWTGNRTASGRWPKRGRTIAVNPDRIPLGSVVWIDGIGKRIAEDIIPPASIRKGADIDIYFGRGEDAVQDALKWGRRKKWKAWILELPKGAKRSGKN